MSSFWDSYKRFVRQNHQWLTSFESAAQGLTWVLPERFASSELAVEGVSSVLGIFQLLNEHIVQSYPSSQIPNAQHVPLPPPHGSFPAQGPPGSFRGGRGPPPQGLHGPPPVIDAIPRHVAAHKSLPWPIMIAIVGQLEVLAETAAKEYRGEDKKWGIVALVEGIKVILRLLLLRHAGGRMLMEGGEEPNESLIAVANTAVKAAELTENDRPILDASDAIVKAGPAGPSPYSDEFTPTARPNDKGEMALYAFAKFKQRNFLARAQRMEAEAATRVAQKELDIEAGRSQPPWWAENAAASHEALESFSTHSQDDPLIASSLARGPFDDDRPSTSGRDQRPGAVFLDQRKLNIEVRQAGTLQRYDTPRPEDLEMPPPSKLLVAVMSDGLELETVDLSATKPELSMPERIARSCLIAGEVLHVLRPLIYVLAIRRWGSKKWKPWLGSLGVDAASMMLIAVADQILKQESKASGKSDEGGLTEQERSEMTRRRVLLLMYLMRSPVFELVTKPPTDALGRFLQPVPLLGTLTGKALDILEGVQSYYFYTAAS